MSDEDVARRVLIRLVEWGFMETDGRLTIDGNLHVGDRERDLTADELAAFVRWLDSEQ